MRSGFVGCHWIGPSNPEPLVSRLGSPPVDGTTTTSAVPYCPDAAAMSLPSGDQTMPYLPQNGDWTGNRMGLLKSPFATQRSQPRVSFAGDQ